MEIIDAQIHQPASWLEDGYDDATKLRLATEIALAYMDSAGVGRALISVNGKELNWGKFASDRFPGRLALTPSNVFDAESADIEERLTDLKKIPGVVGYRQSVNFPADRAERLKSGAYDRLFKACVKLDLPLMLLVAGRPHLAALVAKAHPDLSIVVDHLGVPQPPVWQEADNPPWKCLPQLLALADFENVTVKFSGAPTLSEGPYPYLDLWPHLNQVLEAFGCNRLMWGTDIMRVTGRIAHTPWDVKYPGRHSYGEAVGFLRDAEHLSQSDKEQMFAGTLLRTLGWPNLPAM